MSTQLNLHSDNTCICTYKNYRGEVSQRRLGVEHIWFGTSEWHTEPQWFLHALDIDKHEFRDFAMRDMTDVVIA